MSTPMGQISTIGKKKMSIRDRILKTVRKTQSTEDKGRHRGWIAALVAGILVLIAVSALGIKAWLQGKKLAKLLHQRDQIAEDAHQSTLDASLAQASSDDAKAAEEAVQARERLRAIESTRADLKRAHEKTLQDIRNITSWDDVDSYLSK